MSTLKTSLDEWRKEVEDARKSGGEAAAKKVEAEQTKAAAATFGGGVGSLIGTAICPGPGTVFFGLLGRVVGTLLAD